jgi:beta-lactamase superfamily II metal-dependent hydrolase
MYEVDFLSVGKGGKSGDAIAIRFTRPDNAELATMIIDAGYQPDGEALVNHVLQWYEIDFVDLVVLTHPDGDHIGGMGKVFDGLRVGELALHQPSRYGGSALDASDAVEELIAKASSAGTNVYEAVAGYTALGGAVRIAGPSQEYYAEQVAAQLGTSKPESEPLTEAGAVREAIMKLGVKALEAFPLEVPFDDAGGDTPRNNSSAIVDLRVDDRRLLFTGDAGVPAIDRALDYLGGIGLSSSPPTFVQIPHHGSRHNLSTAVIERLVGSTSESAGGTAFVSISKKASESPKYPSPRVTNAFGRRNFAVCMTAGNTVRHGSPDAVQRPGWVEAPRVPPLDETVDDR